MEEFGHFCFAYKSQRAAGGLWVNKMLDGREQSLHPKLWRVCRALCEQCVGYPAVHSRCTQYVFLSACHVESWTYKTEFHVCMMCVLIRVIWTPHWITAEPLCTPADYNCALQTWPKSPHCLTVPACSLCLSFPNDTVRLTFPWALHSFVCEDFMKR